MHVANNCLLVASCGFRRPTFQRRAPEVSAVGGAERNTDPGLPATRSTGIEFHLSIPAVVVRGMPGDPLLIHHVPAPVGGEGEMRPKTELMLMMQPLRASRIRGRTALM
jgi:hypothetical protein